MAVTHLQLMVLYAQISTGILLTREICDATVKTLLQSFEKVDDRTAARFTESRRSARFCSVI